MAGTGFELKRIYGRKTLAANVWGTIYATMSTIGPAVLSAVLLLLLKALLDQTNLTVLESRFFVASTTWVFILAMLVAVLFSAPVSRYISDCIFLEREQDICPSAFGLLSISTAISGCVMLFLCVSLYVANEGIPLAYIVSYYFLGVLITDAFSMMTYASALKHYRILTLSFFLGFVLALVVYFLCDILVDVSNITAAIMALVACYIVIVFALVFQCVKAFGLPQGKYFAFLRYFIRYPKLTIAGFAYTLGLYTPTLIYWFFSDMGERVSIFTTTPAFDIAMFMAVIITMPSLVIFVVKVETSFYEKYTLYVSALNNGTYELIQKEREVMMRELRHQLFFVYEIQLIITVVLVCITTVFFPYLNVSMQTLQFFVILSLGVYVSFCMYFTIIVFYYFSDYGGACISTLVFLAITTASAVGAVMLHDFYPFALLLGGLVGWITAFFLLRRRMENLDSFLMC